jgi:hypothetical protein
VKRPLLARLVRRFRLLALFSKSVVLLLFLGARLKLKELRRKMKNQKEADLQKADLQKSRTDRRPESPAGVQDQDRPQSSRETKPPFRPIPGSPEIPGSAGPGLSGTISPDSDEGVPIDDQLAGELANCPFTLVHMLEPAWEVMNEAQMIRVGRAFRIYLEAKGKTTLKSPEIILLMAGYPYLFQQIKNVGKAMADRKAKAHASNDRRPEGDGKDVPGMVGCQKDEGSPDVHPGL